MGQQWGRRLKYSLLRRVVRSHTQDQYPLQVPPETDLYSLDRIRSVIAGLPQVRELGIEIVELTRGECVARLPYDHRLAGNPEDGVLHGGVITTLMDTAGGSAAFSVARQGQAVATLDLRIDYLRPAHPPDPVVGKALCYRLTPTVVFVRGEAYHADSSNAIANLTATFLVGAVGFALKE